MMVLKNRIRECRNKEKIKQVQLAEMVGVSRETVGRLETGKYQNPTLRLAHDVAACLGKKIEIYLRTQLSYYSGHQYGADGYMDASNYNARHNHVVFLGLINRTIQDNSKAPAIHHHIVTYGGKFPIWVIVDYFTLGMLSHFYTDMKNPDKSYLANTLYSVNYQILTSWMRCLTDLRNRCAHYSRLYYWIFPAIPAIPKGDPFRADRTLFSQLYMLKYMYPDPNKWNEDFIKPLAKLLAKYRTYISKSHIGFPYRWKSILKR